MTRRSPVPLDVIPVPPDQAGKASLRDELSRLQAELGDCRSEIAAAKRRQHAQLVALAAVVAGPARLVIDELIAELEA